MPPKRAPRNGEEEAEYLPRFHHPPRWYNFPFYREQLAREQRDQRARRRELPALIRRHIQLLEAGDEAALETWLRGEGRPVTRAARDEERIAFMIAQAEMEDWLYYQTPVHRLRRLNSMLTGKTGKQKVIKQTPAQRERARNGIWAFPHNLDWPRVRQMLDHFDEMGTGTAAHRNGLTNANGERIDEDPDHPARRNVPPNELRLWTPPARRAPGGLRHTPRVQESYDLTLDTAAIDRERRRVESQPNTTPGVFHNTHLERRRAQLEEYRGSDATKQDENRPASAAMFPKLDVAGVVTVDRFRHLQTDEGLFVSALESSHDWRTSYDYLGPVKSGFHEDFVVSDVRHFHDDNDDNEEDGEDDEAGGRVEEEEEEEEGDENGNTRKRRIVIEFENDIYTETNEEAAARGSAGRKAPKKASATTKKSSKGGQKARKGRKGRGGAKAKSEPLDQLEANIDYPYERAEFTQRSKTKRPRYELKTRASLHDPPDERNFPITTAWAEETTGRREWHVYNKHTPVSPVDSPPHSPTNPYAIEADTLPESFTDTNVPPLERKSRRRCGHNPKRCHAWWTHASDECWIVQSKEASHEHPTKQMTINEPEVIGLPESGVDIYDERLVDHYGMEGAATAVWPKIGVRVPYEPMTFDDLKVKTDKDAGTDSGESMEGIEYGVDMIGQPIATDADGEDSRGFLAKDYESRFAHEVHSMAVPIIAEPQQPWGWFADEPPRQRRGPPGGEDDESDDDDDPFRKSYHECSFPDGRPPSTGDPTDPPAPGGEPGPSAPDPKKPSGRPTSPEE